MNIYRLKILQENSCKEIVDKILSLRPEFQVGAEGLFYTLGNALYQNKNVDIYYQKAKYYNQLLFKEFNFLYDSILTWMSNFLKRDVGFFQHTSLPGFHIFNIGDYSKYSGGGKHFDLSYQRIFNLDDINRLNLPHHSFTLSLQLPRSLAGLNIWNIY